MLRNLLLSSFIVIICQAQSIPIRTITIEHDSSVYPWITFLSSGPIRVPDDYDRANQEDMGYAFRVIITTSEFHNSVYFEKITVGKKGMNKRLTSTVQFDLQEFAKKFEIPGELSGFQFVQWLSPDSFEFEYYKKRYIIRDMSIKVVLVTKKGAG